MAAAPAGMRINDAHITSTTSEKPITSQTFMNLRVSGVLFCI